jgi:hypothetical protein
MPTIEVPIGEFLPAFPKQNNPGCIVANNCIPAEGGYGPMLSPSAATVTVTRSGGGTASTFLGPVRGASLLFRNDGSPIIVGGSEDDLFVMAGSAATETTVAASVVSGEFWDFAQFNDFVFATSLANNPQYLTDIDTDTAWSDLTGSPPKARYCERFADFLMLGYIENAPNRIQWSAFNNPAGSWAASRLTQAGFADLDTRFGDISGLTGGRYPMVFQERGISLVQFVGPPTVWRVSVVSEDRGCVAPYSIATIGAQTYFLSQDGFYMTNGSEFVPIGSQKVNKWFYGLVDNAAIKWTQAAVDWQNRCIVWAFRSAGAALPDRLLIYSWEQDRFSTATVTVDWIVGSRAPATSLEDLDALFATLEDVTPSMDDDLWLAGDRVLGAFISSGAASTFHRFNGTTLQADWELGAFQPSPGARVFVSGAQPVLEATTWPMQIAAIPADNSRVETATAYGAPGVDGAVPLRADGKEMRLALRMPAASDWRRAQAVQLTFRGSGKR